jgi:N-acetylglucosamine-6-phosphate deacetylase
VVTAHKAAKNLIQTNKAFHELLKKSYLNPVTMAPQTKTLNELLNELVKNGAITEAGKIELLKAAAAETFTPIKPRTAEEAKKHFGTFLSDEK